MRPATRPAAIASGAKPRAGTYALLDAVRGIACLWVVEHHSLGFLAEKDPAMATNPLYLVGLNGALGVWIFFVVSGYCIANTAVANLANRRRDWVQARVRRIFPPCWFASGICLASALLARYLVSRGVLKSSHLADADILHQPFWFYLTNFTLTQRLFHQPHLSGVYWTLCYEVGFYAVVGVVLYLNRCFGNARLLLNSLHAVTVLSLAANVLWPRQLWYPFDLWPYFGLGVLLYDVICHGWQRAVGIYASLAGLGIAAFVLQHHHRTDYVDIGGGISLLTAAICAAILFGLHRFDQSLSKLAVIRPIAWIGTFSYSLYLVHTIIIGYVYKVCLLTNILPRFLPLYLLLTTLICVGFARGFFHCCERPFLSGRRVREVKSVVEEQTPYELPARAARI